MLQLDNELYGESTMVAPSGLGGLRFMPCETGHTAAGGVWTSVWRFRRRSHPHHRNKEAECAWVVFPKQWAWQQ
jgi:hypothetical protein